MIMVSDVQERIVATAETHVVVFDYTNGVKTDIPESWLKAIHSHHD
jgi:acyl-CoA thioesterase FadM